MKQLQFRLPYSAREKLYRLAGFSPNGTQLGALSETDSRFVLFAGGVGVGKSLTAEAYLLPEVVPDYIRAACLLAAGYDVPKEAPKERRKYFWIVGPDFELGRRVFRLLVDDLERLNVQMDGPNMPQTGPWWLRVRDSGTEVETKSAANPDSFHSKPVQGIILDEAALVSDWILKERLIPRIMRGVVDGWLFAAGTFEGYNWLTDRYDLGQSPNRMGWRSFSMATWENTISYPDLSPESKYFLEWYCRTLPRASELAGAKNQDSLKRLLDEGASLYYALVSMPPDSFAQRFGARPQKPAGLVFPEFDPRVHVRDDIQLDPKMPVEITVDPGTENPYAVIAVQYSGDTIYCVDEIYFRHCSTEEMIEEATKRTWWPQVREGQIDVTQNEARLVWQRGEIYERKKLKPPYLRAQKVDIDVGIERLRNFLRPVVGEPKIYLSPRCVNTIREFGLYRYPQTKSEEQEHKGQPVDKHNHCILGETLIDMPGGQQRIDALVGQEPYVYCCVNGKVAVRKATNIRKTMESVPVVRILMDRGDLICTPDHMVMLADGRYVPAIDLQPGNTLMALNRYMGPFGYTRLAMTGDRKSVAEHRLVYEEIYGPYPQNMHIHHKDKCYWNHHPNNLELVSLATRAHYHHRGKAVSPGRKRSPEAIKKMQLARRRWWQSKRASNHHVVAVIPWGQADVYDMTVPDAHNFIANGVCIHNSLKALEYLIVGKYGIGTPKFYSGSQVEYRPRFPRR